MLKIPGRFTELLKHFQEEVYLLLPKEQRKEVLRKEQDNVPAMAAESFSADDSKDNAEEAYAVHTATVEVSRKDKNIATVQRLYNIATLLIPVLRNAEHQDMKTIIADVCKVKMSAGLAGDKRYAQLLTEIQAICLNIKFVPFSVTPKSPDVIGRESLLAATAFLKFMKAGLAITEEQVKEDLGLAADAKLDDLHQNFFVSREKYRDNMEGILFDLSEKIKANPGAKKAGECFAKHLAEISEEISGLDKVYKDIVKSKEFAALQGGIIKMVANALEDFKRFSKAMLQEGNDGNLKTIIGLISAFDAKRKKAGEWLELLPAVSGLDLMEKAGLANETGNYDLLDLTPKIHNMLATATNELQGSPAVVISEEGSNVYPDAGSSIVFQVKKAFAEKANDLGGWLLLIEMHLPLIHLFFDGAASALTPMKEKLAEVSEKFIQYDLSNMESLLKDLKESLLVSPPFVPQHYPAAKLVRIDGDAKNYFNRGVSIAKTHASNLLEKKVAYYQKLLTVLQMNPLHKAADDFAKQADLFQKQIEANVSRQDLETMERFCQEYAHWHESVLSHAYFQNQLDSQSLVLDASLEPVKAQFNTERQKLLSVLESKVTTLSNAIKVKHMALMQGHKDELLAEQARLKAKLAVYEGESNKLPKANKPMEVLLTLHKDESQQLALLRDAETKVAKLLEERNQAEAALGSNLAKPDIGVCLEQGRSKELVAELRTKHQTLISDLEKKQAVCAELKAELLDKVQGLPRFLVDAIKNKNVDPLLEALDAIKAIYSLDGLEALYDLIQAQKAIDNASSVWALWNATKELFVGSQSLVFQAACLRAINALKVNAQKDLPQQDNQASYSLALANLQKAEDALDTYKSGLIKLRNCDRNLRDELKAIKTIKSESQALAAQQLELGKKLREALGDKSEVYQLSEDELSHHESVYGKLQQDEAENALLLKFGETLHQMREYGENLQAIIARVEALPGFAIDEVTFSGMQAAIVAHQKVYQALDADVGALSTQRKLNSLFSGFVESATVFEQRYNAPDLFEAQKDELIKLASAIKDKQQTFHLQAVAKQKVLKESLDNGEKCLGGAEKVGEKFTKISGSLTDLEAELLAVDFEGVLYADLDPDSLEDKFFVRQEFDFYPAFKVELEAVRDNFERLKLDCENLPVQVKLDIARGIDRALKKLDSLEKMREKKQAAWKELVANVEPLPLHDAEFDGNKALDYWGGQIVNLLKVKPNFFDFTAFALASVHFSDWLAKTELDLPKRKQRFKQLRRGITCKERRVSNLGLAGSFFDGFAKLSNEACVKQAFDRQGQEVLELAEFKPVSSSVISLIKMLDIKALPKTPVDKAPKEQWATHYASIAGFMRSPAAFISSLAARFPDVPPAVLSDQLAFKDLVLSSLNQAAPTEGDLENVHALLCMGYLTEKDIEMLLDKKGFKACCQKANFKQLRDLAHVAEEYAENPDDYPFAIKRFSLWLEFRTNLKAMEATVSKDQLEESGLMQVAQQDASGLLQASLENPGVTQQDLLPIFEKFSAYLSADAKAVFQLLKLPRSASLLSKQADYLTIHPQVVQGFKEYPAWADHVVADIMAASAMTPSGPEVITLLSMIAADDKSYAERVKTDLQKLYDYAVAFEKACRTGEAELSSEYFSQNFPRCDLKLPTGHAVEDVFGVTRAKLYMQSMFSLIVNPKSSSLQKSAMKELTRYAFYAYQDDVLNSRHGQAGAAYVWLDDLVARQDLSSPDKAQLRANLMVSLIDTRSFEALSFVLASMPNLISDDESRLECLTYIFKHLDDFYYEDLAVCSDVLLRLYAIPACGQRVTACLNAHEYSADLLGACLSRLERGSLKTLPDMKSFNVAEDSQIFTKDNRKQLKRYFKSEKAKKTSALPDALKYRPQHTKDFVNDTISVVLNYVSAINALKIPGLVLRYQPKARKLVYSVVPVSRKKKEWRSTLADPLRAVLSRLKDLEKQPTLTLDDIDFVRRKCSLLSDHIMVAKKTFERSAEGELGSVIDSLLKVSEQLDGVENVRLLEMIKSDLSFLKSNAATSSSYYLNRLYSSLSLIETRNTDFNKARHDFLELARPFISAEKSYKEVVAYYQVVVRQQAAYKEPRPELVKHLQAELRGFKQDRLTQDDYRSLLETAEHIRLLSAEHESPLDACEKTTVETLLKDQYSLIKAMLTTRAGQAALKNGMLPKQFIHDIMLTDVFFHDNKLLPDSLRVAIARQVVDFATDTVEADWSLMDSAFMFQLARRLQSRRVSPALKQELIGLGGGLGVELKAVQSIKNRMLKRHSGLAELGRMSQKNADLQHLAAQIVLTTDFSPAASKEAQQDMLKWLRHQVATKPSVLVDCASIGVVYRFLHRNEAYDLLGRLLQQADDPKATELPAILAQRIESDREIIQSHHQVRSYSDWERPLYEKLASSYAALLVAHKNSSLDINEAIDEQARARKVIENSMTALLEGQMAYADFRSNVSQFVEQLGPVAKPAWERVLRRGDRISHPILYRLEADDKTLSLQQFVAIVHDESALSLTSYPELLLNLKLPLSKAELPLLQSILKEAKFDLQVFAERIPSEVDAKHIECLKLIVDLTKANDKLLPASLSDLLANVLIDHADSFEDLEELRELFVTSVLSQFKLPLYGFACLANFAKEDRDLFELINKRIVQEYPALSDDSSACDRGLFAREYLIEVFHSQPTDQLQGDFIALMSIPSFYAYIMTRPERVFFELINLCRMHENLPAALKEKFDADAGLITKQLNQDQAEPISVNDDKFVITYTKEELSEKFIETSGQLTDDEFYGKTASGKEKWRQIRMDLLRIEKADKEGAWQYLTEAGEPCFSKDFLSYKNVLNKDTKTKMGDLREEFADRLVLKLCDVSAKDEEKQSVKQAAIRLFDQQYQATSTHAVGAHTFIAKDQDYQATGWLYAMSPDKAASLGVSAVIGGQGDCPYTQKLSIVGGGDIRNVSRFSVKHSIQGVAGNMIGLPSGCLEADVVFTSDAYEYQGFTLNMHAPRLFLLSLKSNGLLSESALDKHAKSRRRMLKNSAPDDRRISAESRTILQVQELLRLFASLKNNKKANYLNIYLYEGFGSLLARFDIEQVKLTKKQGETLFGLVHPLDFFGGAREAIEGYLEKHRLEYPKIVSHLSQVGEQYVCCANKLAMDDLSKKIVKATEVAKAKPAPVNNNDLMFEDLQSEYARDRDKAVLDQAITIAKEAGCVLPEPLSSHSNNVPEFIKSLFNALKNPPVHAVSAAETILPQDQAYLAVKQFAGILNCVVNLKLDDFSDFYRRAILGSDHYDENCWADSVELFDSSRLVEVDAYNQLCNQQVRQPVASVVGNSASFNAGSKLLTENGLLESFVRVLYNQGYVDFSTPPLKASKQDPGLYGLRDKADLFFDRLTQLLNPDSYIEDPSLLGVGRASSSTDDDSSSGDESDDELLRSALSSSGSMLAGFRENSPVDESVHLRAEDRAVKLVLALRYACNHSEEFKNLLGDKVDKFKADQAVTGFVDRQQVENYELTVTAQTLKAYDDLGRLFDRAHSEAIKPVGPLSADPQMLKVGGGNK